VGRGRGREGEGTFKQYGTLVNELKLKTTVFKSKQPAMDSGNSVNAFFMLNRVWSLLNPPGAREHV
jgi:hypothetical protein